MKKLVRGSYSNQFRVLMHPDNPAYGKGGNFHWQGSFWSPTPFNRGQLALVESRGREYVAEVHQSVACFRGPEGFTITGRSKY